MLDLQKQLIIIDHGMVELSLAHQLLSYLQLAFESFPRSYQSVYMNHKKQFYLSIQN